MLGLARRDTGAAIVVAAETHHVHYSISCALQVHMYHVAISVLVNMTGEFYVLLLYSHLDLPPGPLGIRRRTVRSFMLHHTSSSSQANHEHDR